MLAVTRIIGLKCTTKANKSIPAINRDRGATQCPTKQQGLTPCCFHRQYTTFGIFPLLTTGTPPLLNFFPSPLSIYRGSKIISKPFQMILNVSFDSILSILILFLTFPNQNQTLGFLRVHQVRDHLTNLRQCITKIPKYNLNSLT